MPFLGICRKYQLDCKTGQEDIKVAWGLGIEGGKQAHEHISGDETALH